MLTIVEGRVLGVLIEKQRTTPDQYPLSLNALVLGCNQATNREPVMAVTDREAEAAITELKGLGMARMVHPTHGRGVTKFKQVLDERQGLDDDEVALLGLLLLRGPQTSGELRTRAERLHPFASVGETEAALARMAARQPAMVEHIDRQPGQSATRWRQLIAEEAAPLAAARVVGGTEHSGPTLREELALATARLAEVEGRVVRLEAALADLLA